MDQNRFCHIRLFECAEPFTEDGWLITGDKVEVDGEFIKFLGEKKKSLMWAV